MEPTRHRRSHSGPTEITGTKKGKQTCIDPDDGVPIRGTIDGAGYRRAREGAYREYGEVHACATPDVCGVTEGDHWSTDERCERANRGAIEQRDRDERAWPVHVWPEEGQYAREK